ncbi:MAG: DUF4340 domain-containing protein, partial [Gemmataceae bacterium]|nr:DUF4340 domain-containing protein [Gemmataceae bacterium]
ATVQPDRLADAWELSAPVRERPDAARLQQALAAVPELWVEDFIPADQPAHIGQPLALTRLLAVPEEPIFAALVRLHPDAVPDAREGVKKSAQAVTVKLKNSGAVTVRFGGVAKLQEREEVTPPALPGQPRTNRPVTTVYRYAQIDGNPQLFVVSADKLTALFATAGELAEASVVRFPVEDAFALTIAAPGKPPISLTKVKGVPKAEKDEYKFDRWVIDTDKNPLPADKVTVDELLNRLVSFRGDPLADRYPADPKAEGLDPATATSVTVRVREKRPDGEPDAPAREYKMLLGAPDLAKGRFPVQLSGWPRVAFLDDRLPTGPNAGWLTPLLFPERVSALFTRPAVAYRARKLLDTAGARLVAVSVGGESPFALKQENTENALDTWKLTAPVYSGTDPGNVAALVGQLRDLQATEFIAEKPSDVAEYGLDKPKLTITIAFNNDRTYKLEIGRARPGKQGEVFARLDDGDVFGLASATPDAFAKGPLGLLPLRVWAIPTDKITGLEITRPDTPK